MSRRPGDTAWARRFKDVLGLIISDLGGHGAGLSEGQRQLARRAATISIECEKMEGEAAAGAPFNVVTYGMLTDRLGRVLERLGLRRQPRLVGEVIDSSRRCAISLCASASSVRRTSRSSRMWCRDQQVEHQHFV